MSADARELAENALRYLGNIAHADAHALARELLAALDREAELLAWQDNVCAESVRAANAAETAEARADALEAALRKIVGWSYELRTQGESPLARRQPSALSIYNAARDALAAHGKREVCVCGEINMRHCPVHGNPA